MGEEKMTEIIPKFVGFLAPTCTAGIGNTKTTGSPEEVMTTSSKSWMGSKNTKVETKDMGIVLNGTGAKTFVSFLHDLSFEGGSSLTGHEVLHTFTWNEEGQCTEWIVQHDTAAFNSLKGESTLAPLDPAAAPAEGEVVSADPAAADGDTTVAPPAEEGG